MTAAIYYLSGFCSSWLSYGILVCSLLYGCVKLQLRPELSEGSTGQEAGASRAAKYRIWNWYQILREIVLFITVTGPVQDLVKVVEMNTIFWWKSGKVTLITIYDMGDIFAAILFGKYNLSLSLCCLYGWSIIWNWETFPF